MGPVFAKGILSFFALVGLVLSGIAVRLILEKPRFLEAAGRTGAVVIRLDPAPMVRFTTRTGRTIEFTGVATNPSPWHAGDNVSVLFDASRPEQAYIDSWIRHVRSPMTWRLCPRQAVSAGFEASGAAADRGCRAVVENPL